MIYQNRLTELTNPPLILAYFPELVWMVTFPASTTPPCGST